jgi:hypothetical protein
MGYLKLVEEKGKRLAWHVHLQGKYERAARYPWLPVVPDPPYPE